MKFHILTTLLLTTTSALAASAHFPSICTKPCRKALQAANALQAADTHQESDHRLCAPGSVFITYKFECWACMAVAGGGSIKETEFEDVGRWCGELGFA
ncbi:hypothetical protein B0T21DRAFT_277198 [Apiosordaria backusii]|uniref:Uncharacterized protein n=1 Tax=Apiosordaria backusii TaxID=314023 RepID=A0AA40K735_9PEZI|nr:hypothetical protein B0T21DRAFT_277198 [Apiosordaria backusii]